MDEHLKWMNAHITNTTFTLSSNSLNSSARFVVNVVFSLQYCVSRLLLIFFLSLLGGGWGHTSCFYVDVLPMILKAPNLWWYWIVTISQVWWLWLVACSCHPWGKLIPQKEMGCTSDHAAAREEALCLHETGGWWRFLHHMCTGNSMSDVWLSFGRSPRCFSEGHGSCG